MYEVGFVMTFPAACSPRVDDVLLSPFDCGLAIFISYSIALVAGLIDGNISYPQDSSVLCPEPCTPVRL